MTAIQTRYLGATATKSSRIKAWSGNTTAESVTISYPHEASEGEGAHRVAAEALQVKMGWERFNLVGGGLPNDDWAFCLVMKEVEA